MKIKALSLLMAICMVIGMIPGISAAGIEDYPALEFGVEMTLANVGGEYTYVTFTPETTDTYRFYSVGVYDTAASLMDAQMNQLAFSDDCRSSEHGHDRGWNFCIIQELQAGTTYVLGVKSYDGNTDLTIGVGCLHVFGSEITRKPTCAEPGIKTYTCTKCGYSYIEEITVPHSYIYEDTRKATCAEPGIRTYTCAVCGDSYTEKTSVPHKFVSIITEEGTCAKSGTIVNTCDVCGYQETDEYSVMHQYEEAVIKEPTCTEDGLYRYTCTLCGFSYDQEMWSRHDYRKESIPGSCTQEGYDVYTCILCGYSYINEEDGWYEHDYEKVIITEPTCTKPGSYVRGCTICGENDGVEQIDALGHAYGEDLKCIRCGEAALTEGNWEHMHWTLNDGVLTITGVGQMPELLFDADGYSEYWVDNTPWQALPVREAVIGEGITNVAAALFQGREELQKVTLPGTLEVIDPQAFENCSGLTAVELPEGLTEIGADAFRGCALTEIVLPEGLIKLGSFAFAYCDLRQVHIPAATRMGDEYDDYAGCFARNRKLERITVDENNPMYCTDDQNALYSKDMTALYMIPCATEGTFVVPACVTEITADIAGCGDLDTIEVESGNAVYTSRDGMLYRYAVYQDSYEDGKNIYRRYDNVLQACPPAKELGCYTIDAETSMVLNDALHNCVKLTELTIPKTCKISGIGNVVKGCTSLTAVWFEEGHPDAFSDDKGLVYNTGEVFDPFAMQSFAAGEALLYLPCGLTGQYSIPEGIRYMGGMCLNGTQLSSIRFPKSLEAFGSHVLMNTDTVEQLIFTGEQPFTCFMIDGEWAEGVDAKVYYPDWMASWSDPELYTYDCDMTYIPYEQGKEPVWSGDSPFLDVPVGAFYAAPVAWAVENNITSGATADSFNPNGQCLRAQVVTFLWRAEGCPKPTSTVNPFVDVKPTDFYYDAVLWAVENNITSGSDATHFNPLGVCNRAQVVTFLHRAKNSPAPGSMDLPFTDVPSNAWYAAPVAWAVETGVTAGLTATTFGPNAACNRAQVVTFLYRAYE